MKKLFFTYQNRFQLAIASLGVCVGLLFMLTAVHFLQKVYSYGESSEMLSENTLVVQKKISRAAHLGLGSPNFTNEQILSIQEQPFVAACSPIFSNQFDVVVQIDDPVIPSFNSNIYLQSVEKQFLDVGIKEWVWKPSSPVVPIIMPRDFLMMLNTFLTASNLPQLSEDLVSNVKMNLLIGERNNRLVLPAKISGFTNEFSAILVPSSFLEWANNNYAINKEVVQGQLVMQSTKGNFGLLESYLNENGMESADAQVFVARLKSGISIMLFGLVCLSLITVALSIVVLVQYLQLMLSNSLYELRVMLRLGHTVTALKNVFLRYFLILFAALSGIALIAFYFLRIFIEGKLHSSGILLDSSYSEASLFSLFMVFVIFVILVNYSTYYKIRAQFHA